jgi:small subunit ribosomal protein S16
MPKEVRDAEIDDREIARVEAIIRSMTPPSAPTPTSSTGRDGAHRRGSGTNPNEVAQLIKQFREVQSKMMKRHGRGGLEEGLGRRKAKKAKKGKGRARRRPGHPEPPRAHACPDLDPDVCRPGPAGRPRQLPGRGPGKLNRDRCATVHTVGSPPSSALLGAPLSPRTYRKEEEHVAVKLRLMRMGKKKQPTYRVVAADARSPRDGRFIEIVGTYDPRREPSVIKIDNEKAVKWLRTGAQPTETVEKLLKISGAVGQFKDGTPPPAVESDVPVESAS